MRILKYNGPKLDDVMSFIKDKRVEMLREPLKKLSTEAKKDAQSKSPVLTGAFRKSIGKRTTISKRKNIAYSKIGVKKKAKAMKYAAKVEGKYRIFRRLEYKYKKKSKYIIAKGIKEYWAKQKVT